MPKKLKSESSLNEPADIPIIDFPSHSEEEVIVKSDKDKDKKKKKIKFEEENKEEGQSSILDKLPNFFNEKERLKAIYLQRPSLAKLKAPKEVEEIDGMSDEEVRGRIAVCEAHLSSETSGSLAETALFGVSSFVDKMFKLDGKLLEKNMSDENLKNSIKSVLGSRLFLYLSEEVKMGALFGLNTVSSISEKKRDAQIRELTKHVPAKNPPDNTITAASAPSATASAVPSHNVDDILGIENPNLISSDPTKLI